MKNIVLIGAAANLGSYLREPLTKLTDTLASTDVADDIGMLHPGETYEQARLAQYDQVNPLLEDADMVVRFGTIGDEAPFDNILRSNIIGACSLWKAARPKTWG